MALAVGVNVILTPPCVLHEWFSIQNIQGGVELALTSTPAGDAFGFSAALETEFPVGSVADGELSSPVLYGNP